jgi:hypothetical protein
LVVLGCEFDYLSLAGGVKYGLTCSKAYSLLNHAKCFFKPFTREKLISVFQKTFGVVVCYMCW